MEWDLGLARWVPTAFGRHMPPWGPPAARHPRALASQEDPARDCRCVSSGLSLSPSLMPLQPPFGGCRRVMPCVQRKPGADNGREASWRRRPDWRERWSPPWSSPVPVLCPRSRLASGRPSMGARGSGLVEGHGGSQKDLRPSTDGPGPPRGEGGQRGWAVVSSTLGLALAVGLPHFGGPGGLRGCCWLPFRPCLGGPSPLMPTSWGVGAWWGTMHGF